MNASITAPPFPLTHKCGRKNNCLHSKKSTIYIPSLALRCQGTNASLWFPSSQGRRNSFKFSPLSHLSSRARTSAAPLKESCCEFACWRFLITWKVVCMWSVYSINIRLAIVNYLSKKLFYNTPLSGICIICFLKIVLDVQEQDCWAQIWRKRVYP